MRQFDLVSLFLDAYGTFLDAIGNIPFGSVLLKVTLVLGMAIAACALLNRQSAAIRHRIWVLALGVTLALPLALLLPQFELRVLPEALASTRQALSVAPEVAQAKVPIAPAEKTLPESKAEFSRQESALPVGMKTESIRAESATESRQNSITDTSPARSAKGLGIGNLLVFIWLLGASVASLLFVISLAIQTIQLSRLRRVNDVEWADSMNDAARRLELQRPIITLESDQACVPAVIGILSPRLVVPHDWRTWSLAQRNCILLHELAHVKRFDVPTQFIGRLALLTYWFHPLVWFAVRQLRAERELASDDCVLLAGPAASVYAEELLRTLRCYRPVRATLGVAMAHSARLDQRVLAILDARRCRNPLGTKAAIVLLCLFGMLGGVFGGVTLASRLVEETTKKRFQFHPEPIPATELKIGITAGKTVAVVVGPEKQKLGLKLVVTIENESMAAIKALLPHEWHGGQWPSTSLYAAVAPAGAKELAAYHPVYRFGESSAESRNVTIEASGTHKIEIRTDWPGTDTPAFPLIDKPGKYSAKFALVFEADGKQQVAESDVVTLEYAAVPAAEKEPFTAWGERGGCLQVGLGFPPGERRAYRFGESVTLVVRIRNIDGPEVTFEYLKNFFDENPDWLKLSTGKLDLEVTDAPPVEKKDVLDKLRGEWSVDELAEDGKLVKKDMLEKAQVTITARRIELRVPNVDPDHRVVDMSYDLVPEGINIFDWKEREQEKAPNPMLGVYKLKGDTLMIAFNDRERGRRPLRAEADKGLIYLKLKRSKAEGPAVNQEKEKEDEKRPLTAKELTGRWFGEAENKDGIRKLEATLDFDILVAHRPEVRCSLRYSTPLSTNAAAQLGIDLAKIDDGATRRVNLRLENGKVVLGHLARGENGTIVLTMLPEVEKRNMKDELIYRRFEGLVLRRMEEPKEQAKPSDRPGDSAPQCGSARPGP